MTDKYIPQQIEPKWQKRWEDDGLYRTVEDPTRLKYYFLTMLPYPSADYLHIGHWYVMTPSDARARYIRMNGYNVFYPIGFDAFGLPAENAAIERGIHPFKWAWDSIEVMRRQLPTVDMLDDVYRALGFRLSLDALASATLGVGKSADGLQAICWWRQGKMQELFDYCRQDVEVTRQLYEFGRQNKYVQYRDRQWRMRRVPVNWSNG